MTLKDIWRASLIEVALESQEAKCTVAFDIKKENKTLATFCPLEISEVIGSVSHSLPCSCVCGYTHSQTHPQITLISS